MGVRVRFGEYEVVRLLGKGGMSEVYEVENIRLGSRHALKLFTYENDDDDVRERFLTEGKILARLHHPRIVKVVDFGTEAVSGRPYFVMDLVRDEHGQVRSLADVKPGMADEEMVGRWYDDLREGLNYIHANGVIHRDLKLQNALIGPDGHVVLADFGISKVFDARGDGTTLVDAVDTIVKMREGRSLVMGSIGYMAPELEMGVVASRQSDLYALGVIVYQLLTGTWCDARTDIVSTLESYDPVWVRIVPKLLHANPQGRECLSYAEERRTETELREFDLEEKLMAEKRRGRAMCLAVKWLIAVVLMMTTAVGVLVARQIIAARNLRYEFDDFFGADVVDVAGKQAPEVADLDAARIDLQTLTFDMFKALNDKDLTINGAIVQMGRMHRALRDNKFANWPYKYKPLASQSADAWLLGVGIEAMKKRKAEQ